jgi:hypothetical protein
MAVLFPLAVAGAGHVSDAVPTVLLALAFAFVLAKLAESWPSAWANRRCWAS